MRKLHQLFLHIGSNLGERVQNLLTAKSLLKENVGSIKKASPIYETKAWGLENQPDFLNQAFWMETTFEADNVLKKTQEIEQQMGRIKTIKWGERCIDIDILFFNDLILKTDRLTIPHALLHERNFVLRPMKDIAPNWQHPVFQKSIDELYDLQKSK